MDILNHLDMKGVARIQNLPDAISPSEPATKGQMDSAIEGIAWKDSVRVATQANINLASPGATVDGITMATNDRVLVRSQTAGAENGLYIWNGAATAMTRAADANTAAELEQATVTVEEGTSAGATFRQTAVNFTLGTTTVTFTNFGTASPSATEATPGIAEIATQAETDAGTDDARIVTPAKLANWSGRVRKYSATIGDGTATSYAVTHNLGSLDLHVTVYAVSTGKEVIADVTHTSTTVATIGFASAPTAGQYRVVIIG